jgi:hypothetical protein
MYNQMILFRSKCIVERFKRRFFLRGPSWRRLSLTLSRLNNQATQSSFWFKPPPAQVASKVYFRNWLFQRQAGSKEKRGGLFGGLGAGLGLGKNKKNKKSESQPKNDGVESKVVKTPKPKVCNV